MIVRAETLRPEGRVHKLLSILLSSSLLLSSGGAFAQTRLAPTGAASAAPGAAAPAGLSLTLGTVNLAPVSLSAGLPGATALPTATAPLAPGLTIVPAAQVLPVAAPAAPAGSVAEAVADAQAEREGESAVASLKEAVDAETAPRAFEGSGFRKSDAPHQPDLRLDPQPVQPERGGLSWNAVQIPTARALGIGTLNKVLNAVSRIPTLGWITGADTAIILPGNPQTEAGVEAGLRQLIASRPDLFGNLPASDFRTVLVKKVTGQAGLADTFYANFRQTRNTLAIEGSYLNFTVKILAGQTVVVGTLARLHPEARPDTAGRLTTPEIEARAWGRLGTPPAADEALDNLDRRIMFLRGQWRTVQLYFHPRKVVMIAVDVNSGDTFGWDPRMTATTAAQAGSATGRGVADGPHVPGVELKPLALGHIQITASNGKTFYADASGKFTVEGAEGETVTLTAKLSGRYAAVNDQQGKPLSVTATAKAGEELRIVFNPEGSDENAVAQVNGYYHTTLVHDWLAARGVNLESLNNPMPVNTNINDDCNAYFTPWSPSVNYFRSSSRCVNSSYGDVAYHEYGHAVDNAAGGILNGGLSEGWGDILTLMITGQPVVGRGFIKGQKRDYIRHGENDYKYNRRDEVHQQGEAWMGFAWKLRKALIASLGAEKGAELVEALIVPVFLASVRDIPSAVQQVLLRDVGADGAAPHLKEIQAAAKHHGMNVTLPVAGQSEGLYSALAKAAAQVARSVAGPGVG